MVVDSEDLRALVAYLSVVLFFTTRPSEDEDFWFLGTKVPADSKPGVAVSPILIHSTLHRYGKALLKPWFCSYSLGKAVLPCSTRRSLALFSFWPCSSLLPHARPPATKNLERGPPLGALGNPTANLATSSHYVSVLRRRGGRLIARPDRETGAADGALTACAWACASWVVVASS